MWPLQGQSGPLINDEGGGIKTQVAGYTNHLLKSKRVNKGKTTQLECNYELIKLFYMYTHRYLAATNMNSTTKIQSFRHLQ